VADTVEIILALRNLRQFLSGTSSASKGIEGVGKSADKSGRQAKAGWKSIAKWGGAAGLLYGATRFVKSAVGATEELGKSTLALNRTTGMSVKTSSEWATVLKARGQNVKPFQMGLIKLSKVMETARLGESKEATTMRELRKQYRAVSLVGGKDAPKALAKLDTQMQRAHATGEKTREIWTRLGVSMDAIKRGDIQTVLAQTSDAFARMKNPAERAALAQQLFSRQGRELAPLLFKGSKAINEQLKTAGKYVNFREKDAAAVAEEIKHQRELRMAYLGVQTQLGTALLPVLTSATGLLIKMLDVLRPLTNNALAFKIALAALTIAFIAYKIALIAATLAETGFVIAGAPLWVILLGVAAALVAVGIATYFVVKHWDTLKHAAEVVWTWIKGHWPLLVGILVAPWVVAIVQIIKHWDDLKRWARELVDFIIGQFERLLNWMKTIPSKIPGLLGKAGGALGWAAKHAPGAVGAMFAGQHGGVVPHASRVLVGEVGPEVVSLPRGATVTPLPAAAGLAGAGVFESAVIPVQVVLDRRVVGESVARYTSDKIARH
jgi:hypothetical protein